MNCSFHSSGEISERFDKIIKELGDSGSACFVTDGGEPKAVLLDLSKYHAMMDIIETQDALGDARISADTMRAILEKTEPDA